MFKILIATPIFPPAIGGPATYADNLARELTAKGHAVTVLSYGENGSSSAGRNFEIFWVSSRLPVGIRHLAYFLKSLRLLSRNDAVLVFDPFAVGVPVALACRLREKPMLFRIEGDFLWEAFVERTGKEITLREFRRNFGGLQLSLKERFSDFMSNFACKRARKIVFSSRWRKEIFLLSIPVKEESTAIISSVWPRGGSGREARERVMLFAGRFIKAKNIRRIISAFLAVTDRGWQFEIIGDGPEKKEIARIAGEHKTLGRVIVRPILSNADLVVRIASVHALLLPSITDVSPSVVLECIKTGTPFILTKESSFFERLQDVGLFVDPLNESDIREKIQQLLDQQIHSNLRRKLAAFDNTHSWSEAADEWLALISGVLQI